MRIPALLTLILTGCCGTAAAAPQMSESSAEFFASGDFDGDGRLDTLIIDKASGVMRIGYQTAAESWTWARARPAGAIPVTGAAVGHFLDASRDSIALLSPAANRVLVHPATSTSVPGIPVELFDLAGPDAVAPMPLPAFGGVAGRDQVLSGSALDPNAAPYAVAGREADGGNLFVFGHDAPMRRGQPVLLKTGTEWRAAFLADTGASTELRVYQGTVGFDPVLTSAAVPAGAHYASAFFNTGSPLAQFIFWTPGTPQLRIRPVTEPAADTFQLGAETVRTLAGNISQLIVLNDPAGPRLLVIFNDGASAASFTFNGSAAPVQVAAFSPAAGERFRAASLSAGGGFVLTSAPAANARSQTFRPYRRASATSYTPLTSASLPVVTTNAGRVNVLLFAEPPFLNEGVRPVAALHAGDWTRSISISAGGTVTAVAETFGGTSAGLDNPQTVSLGSAFGASDVLANQFQSWLSVSSLRAVYDSPDIEPSISPMPGNYDQAQQLVLSAPAGVTAYYRLGTAPWQVWAGAPVWMTEDTTVLYYGTDGTPRNSAMRTAVYTFTKDGPYLDSDHDGVPDFVEIAKGLNPLGGPDSDGDGWGDDAELLAGTNPALAGDKPGDPLPVPPRQANTGVNLTATLRSWRNHAPDLSIVPADGTSIDALDISKALIASRKTVAGLDNVVIEDLAVPADTRFISLTTQGAWQRFAVFEPLHASQVVALVPAPAPPTALQVNYVPGGGTPEAEADAWIAALEAAEAAQTPRDISATLSPIDTLAALLMEKKIDDILITRGADPARRLSLFDTGLTDAGARRVSPTALAALELPGRLNEPAWRMAQIHSLIDAAVKASPGSTNVQSLRLLASDIYEAFDSVWQPPTTADPDGNTAAFPAPIDVLRSLVRGEALPAGYQTVTTLTPSQITAARAAITTILALPTARPQATLTLTVRTDTWRTDATVFNNGAATVALVDNDGAPWRFKGSVALPATATVQVRGFTDRPAPPPATAASTLEVISVLVQTLPAGTVTDSDGDGLGDEWELVFFGSLTQTAANDPDGDGRTNAQEFASGTDPVSGGGGGAFVFAAATPQFPMPELGIALAADGEVELTWECPEECRRTLLYTLECDPGLDGAWQLTPALPEFLPDGRMRFTVHPETPGRCFYRVRVTQP